MVIKLENLVLLSEKQGVGEFSLDLWNLEIELHTQIIQLINLKQDYSLFENEHVYSFNYLSFKDK